MPLVPLEGISVTLFKFDGDDASNYKSTTTDALGQFSLTGVRPNQNYKIKFEDGDGNYVTVYFASGSLNYDLDDGSAYYYTEDTSIGTITMPSGIVIDGTVQGES